LRDIPTNPKKEEINELSGIEIKCFEGITGK
jgi:hypothetical protein